MPALPPGLSDPGATCGVAYPTREAPMDYGLFTMPSHPPERGLYDGHQWDLQQLHWADELGFSGEWWNTPYTGVVTTPVAAGGEVPSPNDAPRLTPTQDGCLSAPSRSTFRRSAWPASARAPTPSTWPASVASGP